MADTAVATPSAPVTTKTVKKKAPSKPAVPAIHPKYSDMVIEAIKTLKERNGSSRQAILKYLLANFKLGNDAKVVNTHLKTALKNGVKKNQLKQTKGSGSSGSFRIGDSATAKPKAKSASKSKKVVKPKAATPKKEGAKPKKTAVKKVAKPKKTTTKKSPKKPALKKAAKKPAAKKASKSPAKKAASKAKKPAAKKAAAK